MARRIADSFSEDQLLDAKISSDLLVRLLEQLNVSGSIGPRLLPAVDTLTFELAKREMNYRYLNVLPDDPSRTSIETATKDSVYIQQLFTQAQNTQRYGMKPGYITDVDWGGSIVFHPPVDFSEILGSDSSKIHPLVRRSDSCALITISRKRHHKNVKIKQVPSEGDRMRLGAEDIGACLEVYLGEDGDLYTDYDMRTNLRDLALQKGKYLAYRDLQAELLSHHFDLTHSLETVRRIKEVISETAPASEEAKPRPLDAVNRLFVPRIRSLFDDAAQPPEEKSTRSVRFHGVVWHIRELPEGWHASPGAQARAEELGVTLKPGETIVKAHTRGSKLIGDVVIHRFLGLN